MENSDTGEQFVYLHRLAFVTETAAGFLPSELQYSEVHSFLYS